MKSDSYLSLCIEQAQQSPLHYRHGSIVVKGGKVIGQGFNDYRVGYDGGSILKSGILPKSVSPVHGSRPAKKSDPPKSKSQSKSKSSKQTAAFKPVGAVAGHCGGGHHANARLSMHSEMMAINSALTSASTLASSTLQHIKPSFKLPGDSKRKRELRREALAAYVRTVCLTTASGAEAQQHEEDKAVDHREQHRYKHGYKYKHNKYKSFKKSQHSAETANLIPHTKDSTDDGHVSYETDEAAAREDCNTNAFGQRKTRNTHLLVPKAQNGPSSPGVKDRMKNPKLIGADLYVVRLAYPKQQPHAGEGAQTKHQTHDNAARDDQSDTCSTSGLSGSTGSLHDELTCKGKDPEPPTPTPGDAEKNPAVTESRPCYRCVSYMHSVGIKRVFWTTTEGKWEGAKVRDLIDQLEGKMASSDASLGLPVFVTKHEVLLLRRLMLGDGS